MSDNSLVFLLILLFVLTTCEVSGDRTIAGGVVDAIAPPACPPAAQTKP